MSLWAQPVAGLALLSFMGCSFEPNLSADGAAGAGGVGGSGGMAGTGGMGGSPDAAPDAALDAGHDAQHDAPLGPCQRVGQICLDPMQSAYCLVLGATPIDIRNCPPTSVCSFGYCLPPSGATACVRDGDCSGGQTCILYRNAAILSGRCTEPVGGGGFYATCSPPGDSTACQSGLCVYNAPTGLKECFEACTDSADCPLGNSACLAVSTPATVEGISMSLSNIRSCFR